MAQKHFLLCFIGSLAVLVSFLHATTLSDDLTKLEIISKSEDWDPSVMAELWLSTVEGAWKSGIMEMNLARLEAYYYPILNKFITDKNTRGFQSFRPRMLELITSIRPVLCGEQTSYIKPQFNDKLKNLDVKQPGTFKTYSDEFRYLFFFGCFLKHKKNPPTSDQLQKIDLQFKEFEEKFPQSRDLQIAHDTLNTINKHVKTA